MNSDRISDDEMVADPACGGVSFCRCSEPLSREHDGGEIVCLVSRHVPIATVESGTSLARAFDARHYRAAHRAIERCVSEVLAADDAALPDERRRSATL
jgi:hypothetical protein